MQILVECKNRIREQISPTLRSPNQAVPDLGIGAGGDPIRQVDLTAENAIVHTFRKHEVSFTLISEESGIKEFGKAPHERFVTADPIDGTTNLMRGIPFYATSIAVSASADLATVHAALVTDLFRNVTYVAQKGKGASREREKITPSRVVSLEDAVLGIDLNSHRVESIIPRLTGLIQRTRHIRHLGANALELCYVADGTTDAFIDIRGKLRATDIAAAWLILREAGGIVTRPDGKLLSFRLDPKQKVDFVAAGNRETHDAVLGLIRSEKEAK
jgi:myo-inositol-1(or 4)-monophosphatase